MHEKLVLKPEFDLKVTRYSIDVILIIDGMADRTTENKGLKFQI